MTGLIPFFFASLTRSMVPAREPWSVSVTAGISSSAARAASAGIRHAPSRIEYSEWTWRWTKGASDTGGPSYNPFKMVPGPRRSQLLREQDAALARSVVVLHLGLDLEP